MTTIAPTRTHVTGGVDTHRDFHVAAALDPVAGVLGTAQFPTTPAGYRALLAWLSGFGAVGVVGVEVSGSIATSMSASDSDDVSRAWPSTSGTRLRRHRALADDPDLGPARERSADSHADPEQRHGQDSRDADGGGDQGQERERSTDHDADHQPDPTRHDDPPYDQARVTEQVPVHQGRMGGAQSPHSFGDPERGGAFAVTEWPPRLSRRLGGSWVPFGTRRRSLVSDQQIHHDRKVSLEAANGEPLPRGRGLLKPSQERKRQAKGRATRRRARPAWQHVTQIFAEPDVGLPRESLPIDPTWSPDLLVLLHPSLFHGNESASRKIVEVTIFALARAGFVTLWASETRRMWSDANGGQPWLGIAPGVTEPALAILEEHPWLTAVLLRHVWDNPGAPTPDLEVAEYTRNAAQARGIATPGPRHWLNSTMVATPQALTASRSEAEFLATHWAQLIRQQPAVHARLVNATSPSIGGGA
jgi:hypothetical protein